MNEAVKPSAGVDRSGADRRPLELPVDRFIARWMSGDRSCIPATPGALVMVPYPGLRSFKPELNQFFFGRERQKAELKAFFAGRARETGEARRQITFVVGGSGSGKSSLTLAGLIAELNTIDMATTAGAWYVAQMRPAQDPIAQLLAALSGVVARVVDVAVADTKPEQAAEQFAKVAAALQCPGARDLPSLKERLHDKLSERLAPVDKAIGRRSLAIAALFQFVDETLDKLDELESHAQRSGKPLLLIHIDQFEEVFREQTDADGRQALMQLLRKVHEYAPERLFVVATMRSEELHKCSEFEGVADVINSSMYLIDLVSSEEIERAIVEPARRQTTLWELPTNSSETAPYTAEAVRWLQRAYQTAGTAALHTADQLPLLQHFLPLLWLEAVDDWLRCKDKDPAARFEITRNHIEKVPGWIAPQVPTKESGSVAAGVEIPTSHLGRCLNSHANAVLEQAIAKWCGDDARTVPVSDGAAGDAAEARRIGFGNPSPERGALIVAFCCLAQLDDRGRPARRFASLQEIVAASGLTQWKPGKYDNAALTRGLEMALSEFDVAGLIERIGSDGLLHYNVNHEAFIRNWDSYEGWLKEKQFIQQRLHEISLSMGTSHDRWSWNPIDTVLASHKRDAYAVIPDETGERLQSVFGDQPIFSRAWAATALSDRPETRQGAPAESLDAIEKVWVDARWYKEKGGARKFALLAFAGLLVLALGAYQVFAYRQGVVAAEMGRIADQNRILANRSALDAAKNKALNDQLYNSIISLRANLSSYGGAVQYRELYASLLTAYDNYASLDLAGEPLRILRATLYQIDSGIRQTLGNEVSIRFLNSSPSSSAKANCQITGRDAGDLVGHGPANVELGFAQAGGYWAPTDGSTTYRAIEHEAQTPNGFALPDKSLICLSRDARWLMFWTDRAQSPVLMRVIWSKLGDKWQTKLLVQRQIASSVDSTKLNDRKTQVSFDYLTSKDTAAEALGKVYSFNSGGYAGFSLPITPEDDPRLVIWSTTGLLDPDDSADAGAISWTSCDYRDVAARAGTGSKTIKECASLVTVPDLGAQNLTISYAEGEDCPKMGSSCQSTIELRHPVKSLPSLVDDEVGVRIIHNFARITDAALQDGWLWLRDENKKTWRYIIGKDRAKALIELKWRGVAWGHGSQTGENFRPTDFCRQFPACNGYLSSPDGRWPVPPKELLGDK